MYLYASGVGEKKLIFISFSLLNNTFNSCGRLVVNNLYPFLYSEICTPILCNAEQSEHSLSIPEADL